MSNKIIQIKDGSDNAFPINNVQVANSGTIINFRQNGSEFCVDFTIGNAIYRLAWSTTYITYQIYVNGAWQTAWTK